MAKELSIVGVLLPRATQVRKICTYYNNMIIIYISIISELNKEFPAI